MPSDSTADLKLGVSGRFWIGQYEMKNFEMICKALESASVRIRIATYSLGKESPELDKIFRILVAKSRSGVDVQMIVNRLEKQLKGPKNKYIKKKMDSLKKTAGENILSFTPPNKKEMLHAKIFTVDGETAILGSANLSFNGMFDNHEIMVEISGKRFVSRINKLLDGLAQNIQSGYRGA